MIDIKQFRENATKENLCSEYVQKWDACGSRKQYIDLALSSKGVDYLCDSIAKGWGVSPEYICDNFHAFINGSYVSEQDGYDSEIYCRYKGTITVRTTILTVLESDMDIFLPDFHICYIYLAGKCNINIKGKGQCVLVCYGSDIATNPSDTLKCKRINKKDRDRYNG